VWSGELNAETLKYLVDSPARQAITHHVMRGITGVWLMINGADSAANDKAEADIRKYSGLMKDEFPPPRIGESYKYGRHYVESDVPLLLEFEVIRIDAANPKEQCLIQILKSPTVAKALEIDPAVIGVEPVAIPVFGRGRTFYGLMGDEIEEENVMGFCAYLLGICSCQVKMQNPGIDLLFNAQWLAMLVGEEKIPALPTKEEMLPDPVVEVPQTLPTGAATSDQKEKPDMRVWVMVGVVLVAFLAFLVWTKKSSPS
jgi:hypothetical protein